MKTDNDELTRLFQAAKPAMERDAIQVALGLKIRIATSIQENSQIEGSLGQWASAFLRSALISVPVAAAFCVWAGFGTDWSAIGNDWALSTLAEDAPWSSTHLLR